MLATIIQKFVSSPMFPNDDERSRNAWSLNLLIWGVGLLLLSQTLAEVFQHNLQSHVPAILLVCGYLLVITAQVVLRRGDITNASKIIVFGFLGLDILRVFLSGQFGIIYTSLYLTLIVFAGLLLGRYSALIVVGASSLVGLIALTRTTVEANNSGGAFISMPQFLVFVWSAVLLTLVLGRELERLREMLTFWQAQMKERQQQAESERKRHAELAKLRAISASMRQAERSSSLLQVFTREVQDFCSADFTSSILFKSPEKLESCSATGTNIQFSEEQSQAISNALLNAKTEDISTSIPGFASALILPLQSSDTLHGAVLVASREKDQFKPDEQNMLNAVADMAGTALHRIDILETLEERIQRRTHDLVVLYNLITIISENWRLQDILELSLVLTLETVQADRAIIYLADGQESPNLKPVIQRGFGDGFQVERASLPDDAAARKVFTQHKALKLDDLAGNPEYEKFNGFKSYAGIPILVRGEMRGVFSLYANEEDVFGDGEMALLASIADHLGIGIENSILWEQSRENAAIEERNRLARNLHDSVSQLLYSLTLMAGTTGKMLERDPDMDAVKNSVERFGDTAYQALKEMRLLLYELRPAVLDSEGLVSALQHRIETVETRLGLKVDLYADGVPDLPSNIEDALYHIALEAFNNIVKHSESAVASIRFSTEDGNIVMEVSDEGVGFDTHQAHKGQGLRNMRERGQMLGGEVVIDSIPGGGTRVTTQVRIPSEFLIGS